MSQEVPAGGVQVQAACHRTIIPSGDQTQVVYFLVEVLPEPALPRAPMNLSVVLDRSGPVLQECLPGIKQALRDLVGQMSAQDWLSLCSLSGEAILPAQPVQDRAQIERMIERFTPAAEPRTNAGVQQGLSQLQAGLDPQRVNRLLIFFGGETVGPLADFQSLADQARQMHTPILAVGVGSTWSEELLFNLTDRSIDAPPGSMIGLTQHIPTPEDIFMIARETFPALMAVVRQVRTRLQLARSIGVNHVWQIRPQIKKLDPQIGLKPPLVIDSDDLTTAGLAFLVEASFPPRSPGPVRVAQIETSFQTLDGQAHTVAADLIARFDPDLGQTNPLDAYVMEYVEATQAHEMCIQALIDLQAQRRSEAAHKLRQAAAILITQGRASLADRIRGEADYNIRQYGQVSHEGRKLILLASQRARSEED